MTDKDRKLLQRLKEAAAESKSATLAELADIALEHGLTLEDIDAALKLRLAIIQAEKEATQ